MSWPSGAPVQGRAISLPRWATTFLVALAVTGMAQRMAAHYTGRQVAPPSTEGSAQAAAGGSGHEDLEK